MLKMVSDAQDFMSQYMPVRAEEVSPLSDYGETQINLVTKEGIEGGATASAAPVATPSGCAARA